MNGIVRSITHWTGGGGRANALDKKHYHKITEFDGTIVLGNEKIEDNIVTADNDYAAHTLNLNTGSGGFAMAGMLDAKEDPFEPGPAPINARQFEAHCKMLADFHQSYGIAVNEKTCLTHAEVQHTLGVKQKGKWDLTRLVFKPELIGAKAVGDYMRERVKSYLPADLPAVDDRPVLRSGDRGLFVVELQDLLSGVRFFSGDADGIFGPITKAAVMAFQDKAGLATDGIVGPSTWNALMVERPRDLRPVTEDDLRQRGSRTIETADSGEKATKVSAGAVVGLGGLDTGIQAAESFSGASSTLSAAQEVLLQNWPIIIVIAIGVICYLKGPVIMERIRAIRTDEARTGANLKR